MATLTFAVTADTPVWVLSSGSGVVVDTILVCEDEQARVVELIPGDGNAFRVQRGYNGTGSAAHIAGSTVTVESEAESIPDLIVPIPPIESGGGSVDVPDGWTWDTDALTGVSEPILQPTFAQILEAHPEITPDWAATSDLSYSSDCVVLVNGGGFAFITEFFSGDLTGGSEPDWSSAPNAGDTVVDGDITWIATAKTWATALATTPTTWTADHDYSPDLSSPVLIWPTTPTGHLYLAYPLPLTSDSSEPDFGTDFGDYTADNDGYWMDAGQAAAGDLKTIDVDAITVTHTVDVPSLTNVTSLTSHIPTGSDVAMTFTATADADSQGANGYVWDFEAEFAAASVSAVSPALIGISGGVAVAMDDLYAILIHGTGTEGAGTLTNFYGFSNYDAGGATNAYGGYFRFGASHTNYYGLAFTSANPATATNAYDVWGENLAGRGTNLYYLWFDSQGVYRIREDATFNSVGQAIAALYNPQFTKYTPGATNFERVILGQWNSNVAEIGNEKGGTGVLRDLRFLGQDIKPNPTGYFYLHEAVVTAAPASGDCDAAGETNRIVYDSTNDNLYVCSGSSGWRKITTGAP